MSAVEQITEGLTNLNIVADQGKKNRIQVSNTKKPLFFYVNLAKRYMQQHYEVELSALGMGKFWSPLVNMDGEVVGVNNMKVMIADGLSFAVPIDSVSKIIDHFKKRGRVVRPWLGLKMIDLNETILPQLRETDPTFPVVDRGVLVPMVTAGYPGDRAGFYPGDVVIEFDGKPV